LSWFVQRRKRRRRGGQKRGLLERDETPRWQWILETEAKTKIVAMAAKNSQSVRESSEKDAMHLERVSDACGMQEEVIENEEERKVMSTSEL
jgi:ribosome biogenesis GTPase A